MPCEIRHDMKVDCDAPHTREEARQYFIDSGLSYSCIDEGDITVLYMFLQHELKKSNKLGETSVNTIYMSKRIDMKKRTNGKIVWCFLYMNSHYFEQRECISFCEGGFIGFAGWAGDKNFAPISRAFYKWCDYLKSDKEWMIYDK